MSKRRRKVLKSRIRSPAVRNSGYSDGGASWQKDALRSWHPLRLSSKSDIDANLTTLRNRAADQATNTPLGSAAIVTSTMHAVGAGLRLFPRIPYKLLGLTADEARDWERNTTREFRLWAESKECDWRRRNNFYDLQSIAYATYLTDGDSFALFRRANPSYITSYTLRIQLLEANRVSNPLGPAAMYSEANAWGIEQLNPDNGNHIINGVEVTPDGRLEAYWVSNKVPGDLVDIDGATNWTRIEAFGSCTGLPNMLQVCHDIRAEQYRGVPYLAPVLENLKQIGRYCNAELTAAIIRSFLSIFFTNTQASNSLDNILPSAYGAPDDDHAGEPVVDAAQYKLGPGQLNSLPKGVDVKTVDSSNAQIAYDSYMTHLEKSVAASLNIPYEVLLKCFSSSYSASRGALLQAQDEFKTRRRWFAADFCQPIYEQWLMEAVATGRISCPGFFTDPVKRRAWCSADWFGPTMSILDPIKDVNGAALRVKYGLTTREREAAEMTGSDLEENLEQIAYEQALIKNLGLDIGNPEVLAGSSLTQEGDGEENEKSSAKQT
ncbi:phage portal protein [Acidaminococcus sp.]|uniref:phage portal protein n=1 Tax=Acidaminococcus sp. TaxID=1872103 RepID=UPI003D7EB72F